MKRSLRLVLVLALGLGLMGMGGGDFNEKPGVIPIPDREVTATVTDVEGALITLSQFSLNGQTVLNGRLGAGKVSIPFSQIKALTIWERRQGPAGPGGVDRPDFPYPFPGTGANRLRPFEIRKLPDSSRPVKESGDRIGFGKEDPLTDFDEVIGTGGRCGWGPA